MISKWLFDRVMSLVGLIVLCPLLPIVALLIRLKMPGGPVPFRQKRVGKDGKLHHATNRKLPEWSEKYTVTWNTCLSSKPSPTLSDRLIMQLRD